MNPHKSSADTSLKDKQIDYADIIDASARLDRFKPLIAQNVSRNSTSERTH